VVFHDYIITVTTSLHLPEHYHPPERATLVFKLLYKNVIIRFQYVNLIILGEIHFRHVTQEHIQKIG
jgi:hypothetical protein